MSAEISTGWLTSVPSSGTATVRRTGDSADITVSTGRHLAGAAINSPVLLLQSGSQVWAVMLLGTGTITPPDTTGTGGDVSDPVVDVPVAWSGTRRWTPYTGSTAAGFTSYNSGGFDFGRLNSIFGNYREEGMAIYGGLKGLSISEALVTFTPNVVSAMDSHSTVRVALWLAPAAQPADRSSGHPSGISLVADQALGVSWPPSAGSVQVSLPAAWISKLEAGTANGVGLIDNTGAAIDGLWDYGATASAMTITYG